MSKCCKFIIAIRWRNSAFGLACSASFPARRRTKFETAAELRRPVVDLIDKENWPSQSADVKGDAHKAVLQKNSEDVKGGTRLPPHLAPNSTHFGPL